MQIYIREIHKYISNLVNKIYLQGYFNDEKEIYNLIEENRLKLVMSDQEENSTHCISIMKNWPKILMLCVLFDVFC